MTPVITHLGLLTELANIPPSLRLFSLAFFLLSNRRSREGASPPSLSRSRSFLDLITFAMLLESSGAPPRVASGVFLMRNQFLLSASSFDGLHF